MRIAASIYAAANSKVSDPDIRQALLLDPYWGFDTNGGMNVRGKKYPALREPEIIPDDEEEKIRLGRKRLEIVHG